MSLETYPTRVSEIIEYDTSKQGLFRWKPVKQYEVRVWFILYNIPTREGYINDEKPPRATGGRVISVKHETPSYPPRPMREWRVRYRFKDTLFNSAYENAENFRQEMLSKIKTHVI